MVWGRWSRGRPDLEGMEQREGGSGGRSRGMEQGDGLGGWSRGDLGAWGLWSRGGDSLLWVLRSVFSLRAESYNTFDEALLWPQEF